MLDLENILVIPENRFFFPVCSVIMLLVEALNNLFGFDFSGSGELRLLLKNSFFLSGGASGELGCCGCSCVNESVREPGKRFTMLSRLCGGPPVDSRRSAPKKDMPDF